MSHINSRHVAALLLTLQLGTKDEDTPYRKVGVADG